jgi:hypothetical protein
LSGPRRMIWPASLLRPLCHLWGLLLRRINVKLLNSLFLLQNRDICSGRFRGFVH